APGERLAELGAEVVPEHPGDLGALPAAGRADQGGWASLKQELESQPAHGDQRGLAFRLLDLTLGVLERADGFADHGRDDALDLLRRIVRAVATERPLDSRPQLRPVSGRGRGRKLLDCRLLELGEPVASGTRHGGRACISVSDSWGA